MAGAEAGACNLGYSVDVGCAEISKHARAEVIIFPTHGVVTIHVDSERGKAAGIAFARCAVDVGQLHTIELLAGENVSALHALDRHGVSFHLRCSDVF